MLLGVVLLVAGCSPSKRIPPLGFVNGVSIHIIEVAGASRTYRLYKPTGLPQSAPLVVMLHGGFGSASRPKGLMAGMVWPTRRSSSSPTPTD